MAESLVTSFRRGPIRAAMRIFRRFEWFPFTLLAALLFAAVRLRELRTGRAVVRAVRVAEGITARPLRAMLWLDRTASDLPAGSFDVCVRLPRETADATLHDVFSVLLTSARLKSIGLYWDDAALLDDQPLWQAGAPSGAEDIDNPTVERLEHFFQAGHEPLHLPVAARREAQTLLKRLAGDAYAICVNLPEGQPVPFEEIVTGGPVSVISPDDYGLTLHERLALVQAADAYIGRFDELGCAAIAGDRPVVVIRDDAASSIGHCGRWVRP
jgi:hypothetical protein